MVLVGVVAVGIKLCSQSLAAHSGSFCFMWKPLSPGAARYPPSPYHVLCSQPGSASLPEPAPEAPRSFWFVCHKGFLGFAAAPGMKQACWLRAALVHRA